MANLIDSMGYSIGKVHTGLIAYLCNLSRIDNKPEPFSAFCESLGFTAPRDPWPYREWNSIDLAIMDGESNTPHTLIEMKVDDHEHERRSRKSHEKLMQTAAYAEEHPKCGSYLYITLGMGEYFSARNSEREKSEFRWIRLRCFLKAVAAAEDKTPDPFIRHWRAALEREIDLQDRVRNNDRTRQSEYRAGAWNIYLLGALRDRIESAADQTETISKLQSTCYTHGRRPDTILNFGWHHGTIYMEITNSGKLRLKTSLRHCAGQDEKLQTVEAIRKAVARSYSDVQHSMPSVNRDSLRKSKTVATFDIGLHPCEGLLNFSVSEEKTAMDLKRILEKFYGDTSWSTLGKAQPSSQ